MRSYRNYHIKKKSRYSTIIETIQPYSLLISRIIIAIVFIFSGFVKAIDPLGFTYKIQDYLIAFGPGWTQLNFLALPLSIVLSSLELLIGLNLFFNIKIRLFSILSFLFMLVMIPLTLYIAVFNPVSDCGCFGDAIKLTNWQTFNKNIALLVLVIILLFSSLKSKPIILPTYEWMAIALFSIIGIGLSLHSYRHLPMIDFRPYKVGVNILEAMAIPDGAELDQYETTFIYEKNGIQKEFSLENYPKNDSNWVFVDQKTSMISKGFVPAIHGFDIVNSQLDDITQEVLEHQGDLYLFSMYNLDYTSEKGALAAEAFYQKHKSSNTLFYVLTASTQTQIADFKDKHQLTMPFCTTDPITLKTMVRANPGLIKINNATVVGKWHWRDL